MVDFLAPLKWAEFRLLKDELAARFREQGEEVLAYSFADELWIHNEGQATDDEQEQVSGAVAVSVERILITEVLGSFTRHIGKTVLSRPLADAEISWASFSFGFRRSLTIPLDPGRVDLVFSPLWYREMRGIRQATDRLSPE